MQNVEFRPISTVFLPSNTFLGQQVQVFVNNASFLFCVRPCKNLEGKYFKAKSANVVLIISFTLTGMLTVFLNFLSYQTSIYIIS